MTGLIIGADIGGTSTRVGVADATGRFLAVARGGPANPNAVGYDPAVQQIRQVTSEALRLAAAELGGPPAIDRVVVGLAGISGIADPEGFVRAGLPVSDPSGPPVAVVTDLEVAYASATPEPDGYALIAGTGAMAGTIRSGVHVQRRDGWGWLLGDDGSGFWLGREAVRATLAALDLGRSPGPLARAVLALALPDGEQGADALIRACYAGQPRDLARFAPLVSRLADDDPVAGAIADRAAAVLAATLGGLDPVPGQPVVLGGSVLLAGPDAPPPAVGARLRTLLGDRSENPLFGAGPGVVGAVWLSDPAGPNPDRERHTRLLESAARWSV